MANVYTVTVEEFWFVFGGYMSLSWWRKERSGAASTKIFERYQETCLAQAASLSLPLFTKTGLEYRTGAKSMFLPFFRYRVHRRERLCGRTDWGSE